FTLVSNGQDILNNDSIPDTEKSDTTSPQKSHTINPADSVNQKNENNNLPAIENTEKSGNVNPTPQFDKKNYGTITEIEKHEQYNPKETITTLKKGNFGKPVKSDKDTSFWNTGALFGLDVNQGTLTNWAAGGDHFSLSLMAKSNIY